MQLTFKTYVNVPTVYSQNLKEAKQINQRSNS